MHVEQACKDFVVLVYGCQDGALLHSLKAHKDAVYAVSWSFEGSRFASGGADKTIARHSPGGAFLPRHAADAKGSAVEGRMNSEIEN